MKIPGFPILVVLAAMIPDVSPVAAEPAEKAEQKPARPESGAAEKPAEEKPMLEVRAVADAAGEDTEPMTADGWPDKLHVRKEVIISSMDVKEAAAIQSRNVSLDEFINPGKPRQPKPEAPWEITVTLTPQGAEKLKTASRLLVGKPLGIVVSGKLISAPTVMSELGEAFVISGSFSEKEAKAMAKTIVPEKKR